MAGYEMAGLMIRFVIACVFGVSALLTAPFSVFAHNVGQMQTTKYFSPDTVQMLKDRAIAGHPGFIVGDTISYIIQYTPIANGANTGVAGYITDYVPSGAEVIGASIVDKDGAGNFYEVAPSVPGGIDFGWGDRGQRVFLAPFSTAAYDPTGKCAAAGYTNNCNARLTELHADTGIFFSTDPRTQQYPNLPTRILQGANGYYINPVGAGGLNTLLGQTNATTHNLWDADQTNAFGTSALPVLTPRSSQPILNAVGQGATPFYAGSAVAGPQTGYPLDNTGQVGPWQRIAYAGSRVGVASLGPATVAGLSNTAIGGTTTSVGWNLSSSNPLPAGTNAVRWATGKIVVGEIRFVKISMRLTAPVPSGGFINGSEVFGGDAGDGDAGQDSVWRYHVPSVADNNSNLFVLKEPIGYCTGGLACVPTASNGSYIPVNAKVRYRITYLNSGNATQTNVVLTDTLPCQTAAAPVSYGGVANTVNIVNGSITAPTAATLAAIAAGTNGTSCTAAGRRSFNFPTLASLGPGEGGTIEIDVQTNAALASTVPNTATLVSTQIPSPGANSTANSYVQSAPNLAITKSTSTPSVTAGGSVGYTITVTNNGTAAATGIVVYDLLPTTGGAANAATRFSYTATGSIVGLTSVVPTVVVPPTLTPYSTDSKASNWQQVSWNFGAQSLAAGASFTISFTATVGASVLASTTPYRNTAAVTYTGGPTRSDVVNTADVTVGSTLTVAKRITHFYDTGSASWVPYSGMIPTNGRLLYRINYRNNGVGAVTNAVLTDTLPCQTNANPVNTITIISGPIGLPTPNPPVLAAGNCATSLRRSFSFPAATLAAGQSGAISVVVQSNAASGDILTNGVTLSATGANSVTAEVQTTAQLQPRLIISKSSPTTGAKPGNTVSYTLTVTNTGTADASSIAVYDWLPSGGAVLNAATRYSFVVGSSSFAGSIVGVTPATVIPPTKPNYSADTNRNNMQEVVWRFTGQTLAPGASFTITFSAQIGASLPNGYYSNNARAYFAGAALTGTVSATNGGTAITGAGTAFTSQLSAGQTISIGGVYYTIATIASATSLTLASAYTGTTGAGKAIARSSQADAQAASMYVVASQVADVATGKSNGDTTVPFGGSTSYSIVLDNLGPDAADGCKLIDPVATGLSKSSVVCTASGGAVCPATLTVALLEGSGLTISTFPLGGSLTFTVAATVTAAQGATVSNQATASLPAAIYEGNWNNNTATDSDTVAASPSLIILKQATIAAGKPGSEFGYTITVSNTGQGVATNVILEDRVGAYTAFKLGTISPATGTPMGTTGLTMGTPDYSSTLSGTPVWGYTPVDGGGGAPTGFDANVTYIKVPLSGTMVGDGDGVPPYPNFSILYQVIVK